jgi:hypothetical protein
MATVTFLGRGAAFPAVTAPALAKATRLDSVALHLMAVKLRE